MAAQVEVQVHVCIVVSGGPASATDSGLEKRNGSAGRGTSACVGIVVGLRQLPIVGSKSEVAAQVAVQIHVWA